MADLDMEYIEAVLEASFDDSWATQTMRDLLSSLRAKDALIEAKDAERLVYESLIKAHKAKADRYREALERIRAGIDQPSMRKISGLAMQSIARAALEGSEWGSGWDELLPDSAPVVEASPEAIIGTPFSDEEKAELMPDTPAPAIKANNENLYQVFERAMNARVLSDTPVTEPAVEASREAITRRRSLAPEEAKALLISRIVTAFGHELTDKVARTKAEWVVAGWPWWIDTSTEPAVEEAPENSLTIKEVDRLAQKQPPYPFPSPTPRERCAGPTGWHQPETNGWSPGIRSSICTWCAAAIERRFADGVWRTPDTPVTEADDG